MEAAGSRQSKPELLAPAGDLTAGLTAFDSGADAVYAGLQRFNARERGGNFTPHEMAKLIAFARRNNRRVYVTLNTLIREPELCDVAEMLARLADMGPHAVIVQDLGVLRMIREYFPRLAVHASTQMGTHNSLAVNLLAGMGVDRVILQRQIPLKELREIVEHATIEVEVFVHGALCCSLSGACLFSSWMGGWSGNRGKCKQPCRRRYFSNDGNGFFFSTKDLYMLDTLGELRAMGVAGLKIEGRLQPADYVESVVTAYRMMLDAPEEEASATLKRARGILSKSYGRKWSGGFRNREGFSEIIQPTAPGVSGVLLGPVKSIAAGGFTVQLRASLREGERIRVQPPSGDEGPAITVTQLSGGGKRVRAASRGQTCLVHCDKPVPGDGMVYKIGGELPDMTDRIAELVAPRHVVDIAVEVSERGFRGCIEEPRMQEHWSLPIDIAPARTRPLEAKDVENEFHKALNDRILPVRVAGRVEGRLFVQERTLRKARQAFWEWAAERLQADHGVSAGERGIRCFEEMYSRTVEGPPVEHCITVRVAGARANPRQGARTTRALNEPKLEDGDEVVLPDFCGEGGLAEVRRHISECYNAGIRRFRVTSLWNLPLLSDYKDIAVTASFPLPVANSLAFEELRSLNVDRAAAWVELDRAALDDLVKRLSGAVEVFAYGRIPILTTRAYLPAKGRVTDARGNGFTIAVEGELTRLYPDKVMRLPVPKGAHEYIDLTHADPGEQETSNVNIDRSWA